MECQFKAVRLNIDNYAECFRFYRDVLGFEVFWGSEDTVICDFKFGTAMIALCDRTRLPGTKPASGEQSARSDRSVLVFRVDDLEKVCRDLREAGVEFILDPTDFPDLHVRAAQFCDPGGNIIEVNVRLS